MVGLQDCGKSLMTYLAVSTEYRRVTDGWTDRLTDILRRHSIHQREKILIGVIILVNAEDNSQL